jgi:hypothetical protein
VTFQFKSKLQAFLRALRSTSDALPDNLEDLAAQAGIHLVIAPGDNLKGGVFTPWRVALYVAGDQASVKNCLLLLDAFWAREVRPANGEPTAVHVYPHSGLDEVIGVKEEQSSTHASAVHLWPQPVGSGNGSVWSGAGLPVLHLPRRGIDFAAPSLCSGSAEGW